MKPDRRDTLRYPIKVPIRIRVVNDPVNMKSQSGDLSEGGLHFHWPSELTRGTLLRVTLPVESRLFEIKGRVVYSARDEVTGLFRTGVEFVDPTSAFRAKLAEEILRIQKFREESSRRMGHAISAEEAARDWIKKYAEKFSELYG